MSLLLTTPRLLHYGAFGMPLALVALPIYVHAPQFYTGKFSLSLTAIGIALLAVRLLDAFIDPLLGAMIDRRQRAQRQSSLLTWILWSCLPLLAGFIALFRPPSFAAAFPLAWMILSLLAAYAGFSIATIAYQSWGAALTQEAGHRARLTAAREGFGLAGVLTAAALPAFLGMDTLLAVFAVLLAAGAWLLARAPAPHSGSGDGAGQDAPRLSDIVRLPFRQRTFRWLFGVFLLNGIAAAIPATLFLFFAQDRLGLGAYAGVFLLLYFAAGAASMPLWVALARRWGEARAWLAAMAIAVVAFVWAAVLPAGAMAGFAAICAISGLALGADLALPAALLAGVIGRAGHANRHEGAYFGVWNWASKLNLALAAGIALPALEWMGYVPGSLQPDGLRALAWTYALLPCLLKGVAAVLLWRSPLDDI